MLSGVVESSQGFHLIKLTDVRPPKNQSVESAVRRCARRILRERRDARVAKFTEELQARVGFRTDEAVLQKLQVGSAGASDDSGGSCARLPARAAADPVRGPGRALRGLPP